MSAFAQTDFDAERYDRCRPSYPEEFFQVLNEYHKGKRQLLVDVGCGPGIATFQVAVELTGFDKIIGTDISSAMVQRARQSPAALHDARVSFVVSTSEDFSFLGTSGSDKQAIDMITAAECAHYFDFERFQASVAANLRSQGTIAIFGYGDAIFLDHPELDAIIDDVSYGQDKLGPLWDQPGRTLAREMLSSWTFDPNYFTDVQEFTLQATTLRSEPISHFAQKPLLILKEMTVADYASNIRTWSAYHTWYKKFGDSLPELGEQFVNDIKSVCPGLDASSTVRVAYSTYYKLARRV